MSTERGPGTPLSRKLVEAWAGFPLAAELEGRLGKTTRLSNDADMQGLAVASSKSTSAHPASLVDNTAGILGGIKLWEVDTI